MWWIFGGNILSIFPRKDRLNNLSLKTPQHSPLQEINELTLGASSSKNSEDRFCPFRNQSEQTAKILAAQNRESRIARFPESRARNRQKFRSEKQEISRIAVKLNRRKSIQNRHSHRILAMLKATLESHDYESPDSRFRIADSVPLRPKSRGARGRKLKNHEMF